MSKDYYKTLGVARNAAAPDIKKSYRRLAKKYHPDVSSEANAEARFKEVNEAYDILKDKKKRAEYDQFGSDPQQYQRQAGQGQYRGGGGGGFDSSIFDSIFSRRGGGGFSAKPPAQNQNANISVDIEDVFHGTTKSIRLPNGNNVQVKIPIGIEAGKKIRLSGKGINVGDLLLKIQINPHKRFKLDGKDIIVKIPVAPWEAALGTRITVPTLAGDITLTLPAGIQTGKKMRLKGRGLPGKPTGHQYIVIQVYAPKANTAEEKQCYQDMQKTFAAWNPRE
jgi:curved DNA-binding protein